VRGEHKHPLEHGMYVCGVRRGGGCGSWDVTNHRNGDQQLPWVLGTSYMLQPLIHVTVWLHGVVGGWRAVLVGVQVNAESELPVLCQLEAYFKGRLHTLYDFVQFCTVSGVRCWWECR